MIRKKDILLILLFLLAVYASAQSKIEKHKRANIEEGRRLYMSEMASWYGTDLFMAKYTDRQNIGGYVSYVADSTKATCVFYSKSDTPKIIGTIIFDQNFDVNTAEYSLLEREMSAQEKDYVDIRQKVMQRIHSDTIFKYDKGLSINIVPLISGTEKRAYVLSAAAGNNKEVIFGNDYAIRFDKKGAISEVRKLHKGYLTMEFGNKNLESAMHTHLPGYDEIMTPTDICTTMLYERVTGWKQHYVVSKEYVSIWDCKSNELVVVTRKAWEKMTEDQEQK